MRGHSEFRRDARGEGEIECKEPGEDDRVGGPAAGEFKTEEV